MGFGFPISMVCFLVIFFITGFVMWIFMQLESIKKE